MKEVKAIFKGQVYSASGLAKRYGAGWYPRGQFMNSGACAISFAISLGAKRVYLLGYDCQKTGGKAHWHDDYPKLGNAESIGAWPDEFKKVAAFAHKQKVEVVNCSRETALTCFPRASLEDVTGR